MRSPEDLFDEADRLEGAGNVADALDAWRQLRDVNPDPVALVRLGRLAEEFGYCKEADEAYRQAISLAPDFDGAHACLASLAIDRCDYETAEKHLRKALLQSKWPGGLCLLAYVVSSLDREEESNELYSEALRLDPDYEEAYYNLGVSARWPSPEEAEKLFRKALQLDPDYYCAHRELGLIISRLYGQTERACEAEYHLRRALELKPDDAWAHVYLGKHLLIQGDRETPLAEFQIAAELEPDWAYPVGCVANFYEECEWWAAADVYYERALRMDPANLGIKIDFARMLLKSGRRKESLDHVGQVLFLEPDFKPALRLRDSFEATPSQDQ